LKEGFLYYDQNGIKVRRSLESDINYLSDNLRQSDINEIWASHHATPLSALTQCHNSPFSLTVERENPICMFGINPESLLGNRAVIWCLATDELSTINIRFLKHSREFVEMFLEIYPYLYNYVHAKNIESINWLRFIGATIEEPVKYGVDGELFHHFFFEKL